MSKPWPKHFFLSHSILSLPIQSKNFLCYKLSRFFSSLFFVIYAREHDFFYLFFILFIFIFFTLFSLMNQVLFIFSFYSFCFFIFFFYFCVCVEKKGIKKLSHISYNTFYVHTFILLSSTQWRKMRGGWKNNNTEKKKY